MGAVGVNLAHAVQYLRWVGFLWLMWGMLPSWAKWACFALEIKIKIRLLVFSVPAQADGI
jgi:hypothetical protein